MSDVSDVNAEIREASKRMSAEMAAAMDLYVLERGPLRIEHDEQGAKFVATQAVRLRLKEAEEIRADERRLARERVLALPFYEEEFFSTIVREDAADAAGGILQTPQ
ncbi:MAG: hypothetical protein ACYCZR_03020 [Burkholderiales bacterium]